MKRVISYLIFIGMLISFVECANSGSTGSEDAVTDDAAISDFGPETHDVPPSDFDVSPPPDIDITTDTPVDIIPEDISTDGHVDTTIDTSPDGPCTTGVTGDPCSSSSMCGCVPSAARTCLSSLAGYLTFPGGYCSAQCTSPADCGSGANCAEITPTTKYCLKICSSPSQCRMSEGYTCTQIPYSSDIRTYCLPQSGGEGGG